MSRGGGMLRVYIAGVYEDRERIRGYIPALEIRGYECVSTWLWETPSFEEVDEAYKIAVAQRDVEEVLLSDRLIVDTIGENTRGGREVEHGIALASGTPVYVVGPLRNVFHYLAHHFDSWEDLLWTLSSKSS